MLSSMLDDIEDDSKASEKEVLTSGNEELRTERMEYKQKFIDEICFIKRFKETGYTVLYCAAFVNWSTGKKNFVPMTTSNSSSGENVFHKTKNICQIVKKARRYKAMLRG